ncbi:hypothetical protein [Catenuloplanes indicus]|uniref:Uncharacterized protein n=1 Tax=Catenuloplanes indicus TaxID=137267 RepID=A0AAE4AWG8_9ACTN|nr:hypothetical protein [Catenuloplanes indicus]MDQ0364997.1 hypothetical protein [Catenuloplanes indicus]
MSIFSRIFGGGREQPEPSYDPQSPEGLAVRWMRWVASIESARHPISDRTGQFAGEQQPDDVFFLAGTFGGEADRRCVVPADTPLFFPVVNVWYWNTSQPGRPLPHDAYGVLIVDGEDVTPDPISTPTPFTVVGAKGNPATGGHGPTRATVSGLWKRVDPLPPGEHVIRFAGGFGSGFSVTVTYHLTVN